MIKLKNLLFFISIFLLVTASAPASSALLIKKFLVSTTPEGKQTNGDSIGPVITRNMSTVFFLSEADNMGVENDGKYYLYKRNIKQKTTTAVLTTGYSGELLNADIMNFSMTPDGGLLAFTTRADNVVEGDVNDKSDVFTFDQEGNLRLASVGENGEQANGDSDNPSLSADGEYLAYESEADNICGINTGGPIIKNIVWFFGSLKKCEVVNVDDEGNPAEADCYGPSISGNGQAVAFYTESPLVSGDTNGMSDVYLRDLYSKVTTRISVSSSGGQGDGWSDQPSISNDGNLIAFSSRASNLVTGDANGFTDIFVHNRTTGRTFRVNVSSWGEEANNESFNPFMSPDGLFVGFCSLATNLVMGDSQANPELFLHNLTTGETTRAGLNSSGEEPNNQFSPNGYYVRAYNKHEAGIVYSTDASNIVPGDTNGKNDAIGELFGKPSFTEPLKILLLSPGSDH